MTDIEIKIFVALMTMCISGNVSLLMHLWLNRGERTRETTQAEQESFKSIIERECHGAFSATLEVRFEELKCQIAVVADHAKDAHERMKEN